MRNRRALGLGGPSWPGAGRGGRHEGRQSRTTPGAAGRPRRPTPSPRPRRRGRSPVERPEQKKTEHDRSDVFAATKAPASSPAPRGPAREGADHRLRLLPRPAQRQAADADLRGDHEGGRRRQAEGDGGAAEAAGEPLRPRAEARPRGEDVARQAAARRPDRAAGRGHDLGQAGGDDARTRSAGAASSPTRRCRTRSTSPAGRSSRRCRSTCSRGWSASTSTSTCPTRSCPSSRRRSSCRTGPSSATSRAARSSRSTTSTGCSRTSSRRCSSTACGCS